MMSGQKEIFQQVACEGDRTALIRLFKYVKVFDARFNIIEP